jgi:hypothetical protein
MNLKLHQNFWFQVLNFPRYPVEEMLDHGATEEVRLIARE